MHILCECPALERIRVQTLGSTWMDLNEKKEERLGSVVVLGMEAVQLNSPLEI